jgi:hypothetical protein
MSTCLFANRGIDIRTMRAGMMMKMTRWKRMTRTSSMKTLTKSKPELTLHIPLALSDVLNRPQLLGRRRRFLEGPEIGGQTLTSAHFDSNRTLERLVRFGGTAPDLPPKRKGRVREARGVCRLGSASQADRVVWRFELCECRRGTNGIEEEAVGQPVERERLHVSFAPNTCPRCGFCP